MTRARCTITMVTLFLLATATCAIDVPYLTGRVTDNAEILSTAARSALAASLQEHEANTGNQIAILTVPDLGSETVETYATAVFAAWKLGQKGKDNGILVLIAPQQRRMRIEVGYGLEASLPDIMAGRIIRDIMTPRFASGDYNDGVEAGVAAIIHVLEKGTLPASAEGSPTAPKNSSSDFMKGPAMPLGQRFLFGAFIFGIIGLFTVVGVVTPGMGWFLYFFLIPFWAMFPVVVIGGQGALTLLCIYLVGFPCAKLIVRKQPWYAKAKHDLRATGHASIGGFSFSSGGSGSSWSSGSSSGSSFSGGGGSSGGGGASGGW